jgi:cytochrome c551
MEFHLVTRKMQATKKLKQMPKLFSLLLIAQCSLLIACDSEQEIKRKQYYIDGQVLYKTHCANCHQENGQGLAGLYPPIAGSDFLKNKDLILCSMRNGLQDTIVVNGKTYRQPMLQALDVAEIATYIYNEWGNEKVITDVKSVQKVLAGCRK